LLRQHQKSLTIGIQLRRFRLRQTRKSITLQNYLYQYIRRIKP